MEVFWLAVFAAYVGLSVVGEARVVREANSVGPALNRYTFGYAVALLVICLRLTVLQVEPESPLLLIIAYFFLDSLSLFVVGTYVLFRGGDQFYNVLGKGPEYHLRVDLRRRARKPMGTLLSLAGFLGVLLIIRAAPYVFVWALVTFF